MSECRPQLRSRWNDGPIWPGQVIINPPDNLPVVTAKLYRGTGAHGGCWTTSQQTAVTCH